MKMTKERVFRTKTGVSITGATLLSVEEAWNLPNRLMAYKNWWWLRSHGHFQYCVAGVYGNGAIDTVGNDVDFDEASIRPALKIKNLASSNFGIGGVFSFGGKNFEIISDDLALCLSDIGKHSFRKKWWRKNCRDYEKSDAKKFVDNWYIAAKESEALK